MAEIVDPPPNNNGNNSNNQNQYQKPLAISISDKLCSVNFLTWTYKLFKQSATKSSNIILTKAKFQHSAPISDTEYTNVILDGLNDDYHPFITSINTRDPPLSIPDLKALLMAEEELIERLKKPDTSMVQQQPQIRIQETRTQKIHKEIGATTITGIIMEEEIQAEEAVEAEEAEEEDRFGIPTITGHNVKFVVSWAT
ncbi:hypothetical protein PIB30_001653 [Stylosanthes scabra]|uniref:Uncharacterized protein n=1 Tax=Stylosanthes scabra TaxID=79078 RepID=A0ABU6T2V8_9FABA|nr:hypothetical protein [Stylosanthes scabra]